MKYIDVKLDQIFVEVLDRSKHPKRLPRRIKIISTSMYAATVRVISGRGVGDELVLALKKIVDPKQWVEEPVGPA